MKKHPLIREIQLGKSPVEIACEHFVGYDFQKSGLYDQLPDILKELVRLDKPDARFVVYTSATSCEICILNAVSSVNIQYWDYNYGVADDDNARQDCELLNEIVELLFGTKRKKQKPRMTNDEFIRKKGKSCPFCLGSAVEILDEETWTDHDEMGCRNCGEIWNRKKKTVFTGFSR